MGRSATETSGQTRVTVRAADIVKLFQEEYRRGPWPPDFEARCQPLATIINTIRNAKRVKARNDDPDLSGAEARGLGAMGAASVEHRRAAGHVAQRRRA